MSQTDDPKVHLLLDDSASTGSNVQFTWSTAKWIRRRRRCHITLVVSIACVVIASVLLAITLVVVLSGSPDDSDSGGQSNCITPDVCNSNILKYIDSSYDPCDDFYNYSCGNWLSANPLNGRSVWGTANELIADNYEHLSNYLARPVENNDPDAIKKSKYIYAACMNVEFIQSNFKKHLQDFIRNSGGWDDIGILPDNGWDINTDLASDHYLGSSAFFTWIIRPDDLNSSKPVIRVTQGGLSLPSPQKYYDHTKEDFLGLISLITNILEGISNDSSSDISSIASDIAYYERSLALVSLTKTQLRNLDALYNPMSLQDFSALFNLDWVEYFDMISNNIGFMLNFTDETMVIVETPEYFKGINETVFNSDNDSVTVNYAKWQLLYNEYKNYATTVLNNGIKEIHRTDSPLAETTDQACAKAAEKFMPLAVSRPFVEEFITEGVIKQVNEALNNIIKSFIERLMENDWLDSYSKDACEDKVNAISTRIAYPDFINDDSKLDEYYEKLIVNSSDNYFQMVEAFKVFHYFQQLSVYMMGYIDKDVWIVSPATVNAYYYSPFNQITILAGILREPYFATNWPPFLNYGAIGTVISHEISHGFDDQGRLFYKNGTRTQWWRNESISQFNQHAQCFVDQYGSYSLQGYQVDGQLTLGENIADNGGVHTAFQAYKNVMNEKGEDRQTTIGGHTLDQLFFVAFAQLWCSRYSDAALGTLVQTDPHTPSPLRVLGTLANNEEFAAAFKCPSGSRMNPVTKCQLW